MKRQDNNLKVSTTIVGIAVMALVLMSPSVVLPNISALSDDLSRSCVQNVQKQAYENAKLLDTSKANSVVSTSDRFQTMTSGYVVKAGPIFNTWSIDKTNCTLTWDSVNAVYFLDDQHGHVKNIVFTLDPSMTKIVNASEYQSTKYNIANDTPVNWGGYEFAGNLAHNITIYKSETQYTIPSVSQPTTSMYGTNACKTGSGKPACDLAVWNGLENDIGANPNGNLVQAGTDGVVTCSTSCTSTYTMWFELLNNAGESSIPCHTTSSGHSIDSVVENDKINSGGNNNYYDITLTDTTGGTMCTLTAGFYNNMTAPTLAPFINERASPSSGIETLAKFTTDTMNGQITFSNGTSRFISTPYNAGYYVKDTMTNGGVTNISNGAVSGSGDFTETYSTSSGT